MLLLYTILVTLATVTDAANRVHHQSNHIVNYKTDTHARQESGRAGHSVTGSYSFMGGDGRLYTVRYVADEKGFRAQGDHLPWSMPLSTIDDQPVASNQLGHQIVPLSDYQDDTTPASNDLVAGPSTTQRPTGERLAIHVPLITKVYSLNKSSRPMKTVKSQRRRVGINKPSSIIRYKLAYQPSFGINALNRILDR